MAFVDIEALDVRYGESRVVHGVSLAMEQGEFLALLGPSGCGKTTILRAISGLLNPSAGAIRVGGEDVTRLPVHKRNIGYVFQNYALFPHLSVAKNVAFGLEMRGVAREEASRRVRETLDLVRLGAFADRKPKQLSGGQQQRVALARALVIAPRLLLLDECLSNLDAKLREKLRGEIRDIQKRLGVTALFVTHDQTEALTMCDRIAILDRGRIAQIGAPRDIYERPQTPFVARFIGRINEIPATTDANRHIMIGASRVRLPQSAPANVSVTVMLRPHRIALSTAGATDAGDRQRIDGVVARKTFIGNIVEIETRTDAGPLVAEASAADAAWDRLAVGDKVALSWATEDALVFARDREAS